MSALNKIKLYFNNIYLDYKTVFVELQQSARDRPLKASLYGSTILFVINLLRTNEDLRSYEEEIVNAATKLVSVADESRNIVSQEFVDQLTQSRCNGTLRQLDLSLFTLVYSSDFNRDLAIYKAVCPYMKPTLTEFFKERIVDFGILGHWLLLERKMIDYDVNEDEWKFNKS